MFEGTYDEILQSHEEVIEELQTVAPIQPPLGYRFPSRAVANYGDNNSDSPSEEECPWLWDALLFSLAIEAATLPTSLAGDPDILVDFIVPSNVTNVDGNFFTFTGMWALLGAPFSINIHSHQSKH